MNKILSLVILMSVTLLAGCPTPENPTTPPTTPAPPYDVKEEDRFGFNTIWMFGALNNTPNTTSAELSESLRRLKKPMIRFPGGTIGNSYHFYSTGYNGTQGATENYIIPFAKIVSPGNAPVAKIAYVINVVDHFQHINYKGSDEELIQENLKAIEYLLDRNLDIPMIELGNELTLYPEIFWRVGNNPLKPIETVDEHVKILTEIKGTYKDDKAYLIAHFKDGINKYEALVAQYQTRINALMNSRGKPNPVYGVPIHTIRPGGKYYGELRYYWEYWNTRARDMKNIHALIPHNYLTFESGQGVTALTDMVNIAYEYRKFFSGRKFWWTEFNANPTLNGKNEDDTTEQVEALKRMVQIFRENNGDYFFLHQFFTDTSGYPLLYKKISATSKPVNGLKDANGVTTADPKYGKKLFYSPLFCWAAQARGATSSEYAALKAEYGCK